MANIRRKWNETGPKTDQRPQKRCLTPFSFPCVNKYDWPKCTLGDELLGTYYFWSHMIRSTIMEKNIIDWYNANPSVNSKLFTKTFDRECLLFTDWDLGTSVHGCTFVGGVEIYTIRGSGPKPLIKSIRTTGGAHDLYNWYIATTASQTNEEGAVSKLQTCYGRNTQAVDRGEIFMGYIYLANFCPYDDMALGGPYECDDYTNLQSDWNEWLLLQ